jgi:hypothetical protein
MCPQQILTCLNSGVLPGANFPDARGFVQLQVGLQSLFSAPIRRFRPPCAVQDRPRHLSYLCLPLGLFPEDPIPSRIVRRLGSPGCPLLFCRGQHWPHATDYHVAEASQAHPLGHHVCWVALQSG